MQNNCNASLYKISALCLLIAFSNHKATADFNPLSPTNIVVAAWLVGLKPWTWGNILLTDSYKLHEDYKAAWSKYGALHQILLCCEYTEDSIPNIGEKGDRVWLGVQWVYPYSGVMQANFKAISEYVRKETAFDITEPKINMAPDFEDHLYNTRPKSELIDRRWTLHSKIKIALKKMPTDVLTLESQVPNKFETYFNAARAEYEKYDLERTTYVHDCQNFGTNALILAGISVYGGFFYSLAKYDILSPYGAIGAAIATPVVIVTGLGAGALALACLSDSGASCASRGEPPHRSQM